MGSYIGPIGGLVELKRSAVAPVTRPDRSTFRTTKGGRVVEYRGARARRSWDVEASLTRSDKYAEFVALVAGSFGAPPWAWLPRYAQVTNLLRPDASILAPGTYSQTITAGGSGTTGDGVRFGYSILPAGATAGLGAVPVVPGVAVTVSIYTTGGYVRLDWLNSTGGLISGVNGNAPAGALGRSVATGLPVTGAVQARVTVVGGTQAALPALTFTDTANRWAVGGGCDKATIQHVDETPRLQTGAHQYADISFTVQELG